MSIPVGIVGVTGYTGLELIRLIHRHPVFELIWATSRKEAGREVGEIYPHLQGEKIARIRIRKPEEMASLCKGTEIVFLAVPHRVAMEMIGPILDAGTKVVDLSADFRLSSAEVYEKWYNTPHINKGLLKDAVYGLVEIYRDEIKGSKLVANPGCYPTSIILGLYPLLTKNLMRSSHPIIIDSKSGTSGAGRSAKLPLIFSEVYDNFRPYSIGGTHRHIPEIEEQLSKAAQTKITVSFNPHLLPIERGIISTIYVTPKDHMDLKTIRESYEEFASLHRWIRLLPPGQLPETRNVRGTMYVDISLNMDNRTSTLIVISCIDNICRGASGQALANANLMCGLEMDKGLEGIAPIP